MVAAFGSVQATPAYTPRMSGDRIEPAGPSRIVFPEPVTTWEELQERLAVVPDYPDREPADDYYTESAASLRADCPVAEGMGCPSGT